MILTVYKNDWMTLKLEYVEQVSIYLIHADYILYSKEKLKQDLKMWEGIRQTIYAVFDIDTIYTPKINPKYARLFGFTKETDIYLIYEDGTKRSLLEWE